MSNPIFVNMEQLVQQIENYRTEIAQLQVQDAKALEEYRIRFLGTKGILKSLFAEMKQVPNEHKKEFGQVLNDFKQFAEQKYEAWKEHASNGHPSTESS